MGPKCNITIIYSMSQLRKRLQVKYHDSKESGQPHGWQKKGVCKKQIPFWFKNYFKLSSTATATETVMGERPDRRRWREEGEERVAAVGRKQVRSVGRSFRRAPQQGEQYFVLRLESATCKQVATFNHIVG